jgi:glutaminyl-peptide cyclotransferase
MKMWLTAACMALPLAALAQAPASERVQEILSGWGSLTLPPPAGSPSAAPVEPAAPPARKLSYTIVRVYPHDSAAFTEGLFWHDGFLYESVGLEGQSEVRKVDLKSGSVVQAAVSPNKIFGEGLALAGGKLIQLTYTEGRAFVYDFATMKLTGEFHYTGEGWGLTTDGKNLIMSDGSETLTYRDPATFAARRRVPVTLDGVPVKSINELEFAVGAIWANIWKDDRILRIDPASGRVTGFLDMTGLIDGAVRAKMPEPEEDVLNGIAYDPASGHFFVTGKCWPSLFEIKIDD